jgi:predicted transcriptional regulator YdeE
MSIKMNYRITELPQFHLTGPMLRTSVADNEGEKSIPKFWQSLMASGEFKTICALAQTQVFPDGTTFGVNAPDPENENGFLYYVAVESAPLTASDYSVVTVAPGQWAVFSAVGEPSIAIPAVFKFVNSRSIPMRLWTTTTSPKCGSPSNRRRRDEVEVTKTVESLLRCLTKFHAIR